MKKIFLLTVLTSLMSLSASAVNPSGALKGDINSIGEAFCGGAQTLIYKEGRPLAGSRSLETYGRMFILPEPLALFPLLLIFFLYKKQKRS